LESAACADAGQLPVDDYLEEWYKSYAAIEAA